MPETKRHSKESAAKFDTKEFDFPETIYIRDIENRVFQAIVLQCLAKIQNISLVEGGFIDNIFTRGGIESVKGIVAEQDGKNQSVKIRVEVNVSYGVSIPNKADEIQTKITEEVTKLSGLHVACVHVVFKGLIPPQQQNSRPAQTRDTQGRSSTMLAENLEEEYSDEFK